jgi:quinolinate synthase
MALQKKLINEINKLKKKKDAIILVHNYQRPEIYEVADYIGDSFELSRIAAETKTKIIVFCGVNFMAETAKILNPKKIVLHPEKDAGCPMADMISAVQITKLKQEHPNAAVVSYVNTNAETKAVSDVCCTSANAVQVVNSLPNKEIIFIPDKNLASFVQQKTSKKIIAWPGFCCVHEKVKPEDLQKAIASKKDARIIVHPECRKEVQEMADAICSTSQMITYAKQSPANEFIIVTEPAMVNRLKREIPNKKFYSICGICVQMKKITLNSVLESLKSNKYEVQINEDLRSKAELSLKKMLEVK